MTDTERVLEFLDIELTEWQLSQMRFLLEAYQPGDNLRLEFTRKGPVWKLARPDVRTNPETCLHNIVQQVGAGRHTYHVVCVSCQATISYEWVLEVGKNYQYDIDHNVWVHEPKKKS